MNNKLKKLYHTHWDTLKSKIVDINNNSELNIKPTNPLLISLENNEYEQAEIKVVIFGQETNSWFESFNGDLETTLNLYKEFFNDGYALKNYGGQFWNGINRFLELLKQKYPNKKIGLIWNNIVKIGCEDRNMNLPPDYILEVEKDYFNIIKEEIEILKPDITLFLSGPYYDSAIEKSFGTFSSEKISEIYNEWKIAKLNLGYSENIFRTYHPGYLWRNDINSYFQTIIDHIKL